MHKIILIAETALIALIVSGILAGVLIHQIYYLRREIAKLHWEVRKLHWGQIPRSIDLLTPSDEPEISPESPTPESRPKPSTLPDPSIVNVRDSGKSPNRFW